MTNRINNVHRQRPLENRKRMRHPLLRYRKQENQEAVKAAPPVHWRRDTAGNRGMVFPAKSRASDFRLRAYVPYRASLRNAISESPKDKCILGANTSPPAVGRARVRCPAGHPVLLLLVDEPTKKGAPYSPSNAMKSVGR